MDHSPEATEQPTKIIENKKSAQAELSPFDIFKSLAFAISILGINAWIAGASYDAGYWDVSGLSGPLTPKTPQQTALAGFIGGFRQLMEPEISAEAIEILVRGRSHSE